VLSTEDFSLPAGTLKIEIASAVHGVGYDVLNATGLVTLGGALDLQPLSGFTLAPSNRIYLLVNDGTDAINGTFAGFAEGGAYLVNGLDFVITYKANFETSQTTGGNDVLIMVPEPGVAVTLLGGLGALLGLQRSRRKG
jgi:hypothetical protein